MVTQGERPHKRRPAQKCEGTTGAPSRRACTRTVYVLASGAVDGVDGAQLQPQTVDQERHHIKKVHGEQARVGGCAAHRGGQKERACLNKARPTKQSGNVGGRVKVGHVGEARSSSVRRLSQCPLLRADELSAQPLKHVHRAGAWNLRPDELAMSVCAHQNLVSHCTRWIPDQRRIVLLRDREDAKSEADRLDDRQLVEPRESRKDGTDSFGMGARASKLKRSRRSEKTTLDCQASRRAALAVQNRPTPMRSPLDHTRARCTWSGTARPGGGTSREQMPLATVF